MTLSELSIRKPVFAWMLMLAFLVFGGIGFKRMGISQLPDVDFPVVNIAVTYNGAAPEVVEANIIEPIEDAIMSIQGIENLSSNAKTGRANIEVEFQLGHDIDVALQEIQSVVAQAQRRLPKDIDPPVISKSNPEDQPIMWLAVRSNKMSLKELMEFVRDRVKDRFTTLDGVAEVFLGGYVEPNLRIWVSNDELRKYALTVSDLVATVENEHSELPAGRIENDTKEYNVRMRGEALSEKEFANLSINRRGGAPNFSPIPLGRIAKIEEGLDDVRRRSRSNGEMAIGLGIRKQRGTNSVDIAQRVKARMKEVSATLPEGVSIDVNFDSTRFIEESVHELNFTLILSAILTSVVCWVLLGSLSATLNVILAIPVSVVGSFFCLYLLGFTLNAFTLLALSLAIGIVVDDAIMVLENIVRHRERGKTRRDAALVGAREITFAALAATAAIIAIFLPVAFMEGIIGRYLFQFGVTLSVAVAVSLVEALTFAPMRCAEFLDTSSNTTRMEKAVHAFFSFLETKYGRSLDWVLSHRWLTVFGSLLFFVLSLGSFKFLRSEFVPAQDQSLLLTRVQTPMGSSLDFTDKKVMALENKLLAMPALQRYYAAIGGFGGGDVNSGMIFLTLKNPDDRPYDGALKRRPTQNDVANQVRALAKEVPDLKIFVQDLSMSGFGSSRGFPIQFTIKGPDWDKLVGYSEAITSKMSESGILTDVDSNYRSGMPEIEIIPNREAARARGVSIADINSTVNALIGGAVAGKYSKGNRRFDVRIRLDAKDRTQPQDIAHLQVRNNRGELIPLSELVTVKTDSGLQAIYHENRERAITVTANITKGSSQDQAMKRIEKITAETLDPARYRIEWEGSAKTFNQTFSGILFALGLGVLVAYMILGSQFNSFIHPITVLVALPFSISGALLSLWMTNQSINMFSLIGIVLLMGIVKKNSILLVDFTNQERDHNGTPVDEALKKACPLRMRAIFMTSIATIAAAVPPAMALGPGAELHMPMAISIIGGVFVSTVLTLFVVPAIYSLFAKLERSRTAEA